ncbi:hypothetical protein [Providencia sp. wls1921]|uniref:hypothetical protein n=1 Tax=Providencia sp. wls1921 TaxID=2675153 RepID=UPI001E49753E
MGHHIAVVVGFIAVRDTDRKLLRPRIEQHHFRADITYQALAGTSTHIAPSQAIIRASVLTNDLIFEQ